MDVEQNETSVITDVDMQESSNSAAQPESTPISNEMPLLTEPISDSNIVDVQADAVVLDVQVAPIGHKMEVSDSDSDSDTSSEDEEEIQRKYDLYPIL